MEQNKPSTPEERTAAVAGFFRDELKEISGKIKQARALAIGVDTNGTVRRKAQEILHLEQRQTELNHARAFVLRIFNNTPQVTQAHEIRGFFEGKLDEIGIETERVRSYPHGVIFDGGPVKGKEQELHHLRTIRADMLRVSDFVLDVLGQPPLVDEKNFATNS